MKIRRTKKEIIADILDVFLVPFFDEVLLNYQKKYNMHLSNIKSQYLTACTQAMENITNCVVAPEQC
jgi:hypothetical protein